MLADGGRAQTTVRLPPILGLDEFVATPDDNPITLEALQLGRRLFFDVGLSRDRSRACASCHSPARAFADSAALSFGVRGARGQRNAPALINRAYGTSFFWDGRAQSLETQALEPIENSRELDLAIGDAVRRLGRDSSYVEQFVGAYGGGPTGERVARALATYVRSIRSGNTRFDRLRGGDTTAFSLAERRGFALFTGDARCSRCHTGPNFTDEEFHNTGISSERGDAGRARVTRHASDRARFRTPTLREVARSAPYMHDGSMPSLKAVVAFYDSGGRRNPNLDREIRPLRLSADQKSDLVAFLGALSAPEISCLPITCAPELPSQLPIERSVHSGRSATQMRRERSPRMRRLARRDILRRARHDDAPARVSALRSEIDHRIGVRVGTLTPMLEEPETRYQ